MGSPKRSRKDHSTRGDIRVRLQALAKPGSNRGNTNQEELKTGSLSRATHRGSRQDHNKKEKISTSVLTRRDSMGQVMERARTEGGNRWTKKLLEEEAKYPDRWGHSGFKELYKNELELKNRRSQSRERARRSRSRSRSRERSNRLHVGRDREVEIQSNKSHLRSNSRNRSNVSRKRNTEAVSAESRGLKRSLSSSDRSLTELGSYSNKSQDSFRYRDPLPRRSQKYPSKGTNPLETRPFRSTKNSSEHNASDRTTVKNRRRICVSKDRLCEKKRSLTKSPSPSLTRNLSPVGLTDRTGRFNKRTQSKSSKHNHGPSSPVVRTPLSRSSESPHLHSRRSRSLSNRSSQSQSSTSRSCTSRSRSSSTSSDYSTSSYSSRGSQSHMTAPPHSPSSRHTHAKIKDTKRRTPNKDSSLQIGVNQQVDRNDQNKYRITKSRAVEHSYTLKRKKYHTQLENQLKITPTESDSSSNPSSTETDEVEDGEDDCEDRIVGSNLKKLESAPRLSLSERFGKLAQLSSQRRNLELVQLRIVAPIGQSNCEKNVSVDESCAAPVITKIVSEQSRSTESQPPRINHSPEVVRLDERERPRHEDRWRDWHERYDQYRHVQPPRHLPRDWDDIRVRHKYYTERGYFSRDMTLDELARWEDWWHRYQQWRRGYERAWAAAHGPHVPVEYPDWTNYRSSHHRESPAVAAAAAAVVAAAAAGSIRSRLGWRR